MWLRYELLAKSSVGRFVQNEEQYVYTIVQFCYTNNDLCLIIKYCTFSYTSQHQFRGLLLNAQQSFETV